ncbi:MAG: hypothetical protein Q8W48_01845 [Candidatus Palauibacterales bacterium]|nr:hypothetical protein [Candidatus Palauibacterales bacterium]
MSEIQQLALLAVSIVGLGGVGMLITRWLVNRAPAVPPDLPTDPDDQ